MAYCAANKIKNRDRYFQPLPLVIKILFLSVFFFRSKSCWMFFAADLHVFHMRLDYVEGLTHQQINRKTDCIPFELQLCCDCYWAVSSPFLCAPSCSIGKKAQNFAIVLKLINCNTDATDQIKIYIICHSSEWMHCAFFLASSFSPKISLYLWHIVIYCLFVGCLIRFTFQFVFFDTNFAYMYISSFSVLFDVLSFFCFFF